MATTLHLSEKFKIPLGLKTFSIALVLIGIIALIVGFVTKVTNGTEESQTEFIGTLMYNTIFWTLICNASMFFIGVTTLAMGGWQYSFRRVPEAISTMVPVFGAITLAILFYIVLADKHSIYHWLDVKTVMHDAVLKGKRGFLNPTFFVIWSLLIVGLWSLLGRRMRTLSNEADAPMTKKQSASYIWRNTVSAALFIVWFALTVGSTMPWLWMMSIDAHWYSTMYSWYTFASSFVAGMSLVALWVIYLKIKGYLPLTTSEHIHDLGKFMFAFSIFWIYLWFSQYMLIWYANIPEETVYFTNRVWGTYRIVFLSNIVINFVCPILVLMTRGAKRNFTILIVMGVLIIFGHWIDFYQMVMGSLSKERLTLSWFDFGVLALFVGMMLWGVAKSLSKKPLIAIHHPFLKESIIHESL